MNLNDYYKQNGEQPLDRIVPDGGFCAIFRTMAFIGDSLASGDMETKDENGTRHFCDLFEHSWGQYIARMTGCTAYNFSRGGMTAKEYWESFAELFGCWRKDKAAQAYVIALGINDIYDSKQEIGQASDYLETKDTIACYYGKMIQRLKTISPDAKFFLMSMPKGYPEDDAPKALHAQLLYDFAEIFDNTYVLDFYRYAPVYDETFRENFFLNLHMNPAGYLLTAKMVASYIDYIIRNNPRDFYTAGLIGTGINPGAL